eukprot:2131824-Pyramimonas_sp.AAC.1
MRIVGACVSIAGLAHDVQALLGVRIDGQGDVEHRSPRRRELGAVLLQHPVVRKHVLLARLVGDELIAPLGVVVGVRRRQAEVTECAVERQALR